jgi:glycosyltransferase involved in cell wall biosynthesis
MNHHFTLVMAYYENHRMLIEHVRCWNELPPVIARYIHVIVVDDGSPTAPARDALQSVPRPAVASIQIWRMLTDVAWNQDACRNLGVKHASTDWLLLTDMDHIVPVDTWKRLITGKLDTRVAYRFGRVSAPTLEPYKRHPNSWALTQQTYWECGGYDERLAGNYGTDGDFLVRVQRHRKIVDLPEVLVRVPREVVPDASTTTLTRKDPAEKENIRKLMAERAADPNWRPLHFSFPHKRVL